MRHLLVIALLASSCALLACQDTSAPSSTAPAPPSSVTTADPVTEPLGPHPTVQLTLVERTDTSVTIDVIYAPDAQMANPRNVELWLRPSEALVYRSSTALDATEAAGKTLVVQPKADGTLRTIVYSASLDRLGAGPVARLEFDLKGTGAATLELLPKLPIFAPAEANVGLMLPDTLVVTGG